MRHRGRASRGAACPPAPCAPSPPPPPSTAPAPTPLTPPHPHPPQQPHPTPPHPTSATSRSTLAHLTLPRRCDDKVLRRLLAPALCASGGAAACKASRAAAAAAAARTSAFGENLRSVMPSFGQCSAATCPLAASQHTQRAARQRARSCSVQPPRGRFRGCSSSCWNQTSRWTPPTCPTTTPRAVGASCARPSRPLLRMPADASANQFSHFPVSDAALLRCKTYNSRRALHQHIIETAPGLLVSGRISERGSALKFCFAPCARKWL
eukprot:3059742-Rhodomonas_salina.1